MGHIPVIPECTRRGPSQDFEGCPPITEIIPAGHHAHIYTGSADQTLVFMLLMKGLYRIGYCLGLNISNLRLVWLSW